MDLTCEKLIEVCDPQLYRENAFRILGLPANVTLREIRRQKNRLSVLDSLGMQTPEQQKGYLPLAESADKDRIRMAIHRIQDPESRMMDEFFWFWSSGHNGSTDAPLELLRQGNHEKAVSDWHGHEKRGDNLGYALHNLGVYHLVHALDLELKPKISSEDSKKCKLHWDETHKRWARLIKVESFWKDFAERIEEMNEPRLTSGLSRRIQATLPRAILSIHARLAVNAAQEGKKDIAVYHLEAMKKSGYPSAADLSQSVLHQAVSDICQRISLSCTLAEKKKGDDRKQAKITATELFKTVSPLLDILILLLGKEDLVCQGSHDLFVDCMCNCVDSYGGETEDWKGSLDLLDQIQPYVFGSTSERRYKDIYEAVSNLAKMSVCHFCGQRSGDSKCGIKVEMHKVTGRIPTFNGVRIEFVWKEITVPQCKNCSEYHSKKEGVVGLYIGSVITGVISLILFVNEEIGWGILFLLGCAAFFVGAMKLVKNMSLNFGGILPKGLDTRDSYFLIADCLKDGWTWGKEPQTSN